LRPHWVLFEKRAFGWLWVTKVFIAQEIKDTQSTYAGHNEYQYADRGSRPDVPLAAGELHKH
jgi:hypothetical protein